MSTGLAARFTSPDDLVAAARVLRRAECGHLEAYTPYAVEALSEVIEPPRQLGWFVVGGGLVGLAIGFGVQLYGALVAYPLDVGGRPPASWPMLVPSATEIMILGAVLGGALGLLIATGLPRLEHPAFALPGFERASDDRFFLTVATVDARALAHARELLASCRPDAIVELPP